MGEGRRAGRPRSASREMLEEAACELFFEQGYGATTVADITQRAGVSRATFFNYISTKSDLLWASIDDALDTLAGELSGVAVGAAASDDGAARGGTSGDAAAVTEVRTALLELADRLEPGTVVLAFAQAEPMGVSEELEESAAQRQRRAGRIIERHLRSCGVTPLRAEVIGAAHAGALIAALRAWAQAGAGRTSFREMLERALDVIGSP